MTTRSKIIKTLRLAILLAVLGAALLLFLWNRNIDPRFYRFLETRVGHAMSTVLGWSQDFDLPPMDKPESEMTERELRVKRSLEARVMAEQPSHELTLTTGEVMRGKVISETVNAVTFREEYGDVGEMAVSIRRNRIADLQALEEAPPAVHYRDVVFQMEFPGFTLYRRPPYTIVTDESFFRVQKSVRLLERMHKDFMYLFEPLIRRPERGQAIQVLFFSDEEAYKEYQGKHAPQLESSGGFYEAREDRLVVFNHISSEQLKEARKRIQIQEEAFRATATTPGELEKLKMWKQDAERNIARFAEEQTQFTVRHEGSHQLFFTYGIHSTHKVENSWLIEGLSVFCEASRVGLREADRVSTVKGHLRAGTLIPLRELIASRSPKGLFVFRGADRVNLAYSQAWSVVHFLMQPKYRDAFFDYIRFVRDEAHVDEVATRERLDLLAEILGMAPESVERLWLEYVEKHL